VLSYNCRCFWLPVGRGTQLVWWPCRISTKSSSISIDCATVQCATGCLRGQLYVWSVDNWFAIAVSAVSVIIPRNVFGLVDTESICTVNNCVLLLADLVRINMHDVYWFYSVLSTCLPTISDRAFPIDASRLCNTLCHRTTRSRRHWLFFR